MWKQGACYGLYDDSPPPSEQSLLFLGGGGLFSHVIDALALTSFWSCAPGPIDLLEQIEKLLSVWVL